MNGRRGAGLKRFTVVTISCPCGMRRAIYYLIKPKSVMARYLLAASVADWMRAHEEVCHAPKEEIEA